MKTFCSLLLTAALFAFASCTHETALQQLIREADVVKVYIYSGAEVPAVHYETNDIDKIQNWKNYIDEKSAATGDCSYEGKLIFRTSDDSTVMQFSLKEGCRQVAYTLNDTAFIKNLTPEGISFINELKKAQ